MPTGTVTFLFSDIEGSTRLVQALGDDYPELLEQHQRLLRRAFAEGGGVVVGTEGDSFFVVFPGASEALRAAIDSQLALEAHPWPEGGRVRVRIGLHTGEGALGADNYVGVDVHRAARIAAAGHGGQVLVSDTTRTLVDHALPDGVVLRDLGQHRLKDLMKPERIFQVVHPVLSSEFAPLTTLSHRPNNLPTQNAELIGRAAELRGIRELLNTPTVRLVTLTGPGGIGKTTLALHAAADQAERWEDGLYFVDLSPVRDVDAVFEAVLRVMGLAGTSHQQPLEALSEHLRTRRLLLLLDNLEQVIDAADGVVDLLQRCSDVMVLATSREALRVRGERLFAVPPLSLPERSVKTTSARELAEYEAVHLFVERATGSRPDFELTDDNAAAVAEICARLDGLPLAIELAAAGLKLFSPNELRDRLTNHLEILSAGSRDLPIRHQTLRSTIEWSDELLDTEERAIFRMLSLFSSVRIEAVEQVASQIDELRGVRVLDRLMSLVDKSLVRSVEDADRRYLSMLETIREYAAERLDEEPSLRGEARHAHATYFAEFAHARRGHLYGPERAAALEDLAADLGNLQTAWRYWVESGDLERLDMLLDGLWVLHEARGWYHGVIELTNDLLSVLSTGPSTPQRAREEIALRTNLARGLMAISGYTEEVEESYERALALLEEGGRPPELFPMLRSLASFHLYRAEFDKGAAVGRQLLDLAEEQDDAGLQVEGHLRVGMNLASLGDVGRGLEHLDRAIALFDLHQHASARFRLGPSPGVVPYTASAFLLWLTGYPDQAVERATIGLELAKQLQHPYSEAYALFHVGLLDVWQRQWELVRERATDVLRIAEEHDYKVWRALALVFLGVSITGLGRHEEGLAVGDEGLGLYRGLKTPPVFWPLLLSVRARGFAMAGRPAEGVEAIDPAIELMDGRANILYPELPLLKGDLLMAQSDRDGAESWYRRAFDVAGEVGGRMSQLRAATRLTLLARASDEPQGASDTLRSVYETFTEGFDTVDLRDARTVLDGEVPDGWLLGGRT
jgi:predicted ATPase/class 3 adenylate cyclase